MPDDPREFRRLKTPHAGVRRQIAGAVEFGSEEATPVGSPPEDSRAKVTDIHSMKAELASRIDAHAADDLRQLSEIKNEIVEVKRDLRDLRTDNRGQNATLSDLRVETAKQSISLDALVEEANLSREKKAKIETAKLAAEIDDKAHAKKTKRGFWWWIARGGAGLLFTAATTGLTLLAEHC